MDERELERIIYEEVQKALRQRQRSESTMLPPNQNETLDPNACSGPSCSLSSSPNPPNPPAAQANPKETKAGPAVLVLLSGAKEQWETVQQAIEQWRSEGIQLDAVLSSSGREVFTQNELSAMGLRAIESLTEIREIMWDMSRYTAVFLPSISRTHAAKLALGITDNITLNLTLSALAQSISTFATNEGLAPTACVVCGNHVPGIQEVLDNYRNQLSKMGLRLISAREAVEALNNHIHNKANSGPDLIKTLITEEDAAKLKGPVVKVARGGLVTPLAMEQFIKRGIEVIVVPQD